MKWKYELAKNVTQNCPLGYRCPFPGMTALLLGSVGALILAPVVVPVVKKVGKSIAKGAIKAGIVVYEGGKELASEAKAELAAAKT
ncbi:MAG: hypothetical protein QNJ63_19085 [Calothrix sp. MO_192.B10]|nr:hypothetical protein [Calothrix sp. MO_192.B10]